MNEFKCGEVVYLDFSKVNDHLFGNNAKYMGDYKKYLLTLNDENGYTVKRCYTDFTQLDGAYWHVPTDILIKKKEYDFKITLSKISGE